jgi:diketogulonate reductase-like aldo/keto reductase
MSLTLESKAKLNNDVEIPYLGLGVYQSPPGKTTERQVCIEGWLPTHRYC